MPPVDRPKRSRPSAPAATPPRRQRRKEARPQELMDAALDVFVEKGFAAARIDEIALRAGVSKGTLYLYFSSKEDLLKAVIRHHLGTPISETAGAIDAMPGSNEQIVAELMRTWWTRIVETPASGIFKLMVSEVRNFPDLARFYVEEVVLPSQALLSRLLERGIRLGEFRPLPVEDLVHVLIAPMLFMAMHKHSFGGCPGLHDDINAPSFIDTQMKVILQGLRPSATTRRRTAAPSDAKQAMNSRAETRRAADAKTAAKAGREMSKRTSATTEATIVASTRARSRARGAA